MSFKFDRVLALRNTLLNVLSSFVPMAVSIATLPKVLSGLGAERYGIMSLAFVAVGYAAILELGLGGAATKYVAEALGRADEDSVPKIVWTAIVVQIILGALGGLLLAAAAPWLAEKWLNIAPAMQPEAKQALFVLSMLVPLLLIFPCLCGVLEGAQRFDLANLVGVPAGVATTLSLYVGACLGWRLPAIMALITVTRFVMTLWVLALCFRVFPILGRSFDFSWKWFKILVRFGGWGTAGSLVVPIIANCDRFMLGRYFSLSDVTYYTVPFGVMSRISIVPANLSRTLFPAFSALDAADKGRLEELYLRSWKYTVMSVAPLVLLLSTYSTEIFALWLGPDIAARCAPVLRLLLYGTLVGNLAPMPGTLLQAIGRPDIGFKWYAVCLPINTVFVWFMVHRWGLTGAAFSFCVRALADTAVHSYFAARLAGISLSSMLRHRLLGLGACLAFLAVSMWLAPMFGGVGEKLAAYCAAMFVFFGLSWVIMLDDKDRNFIIEQLKLKLEARLGPA